MKTILINPPQDTRYPQPPLGLASIAAVLEQAGHEVGILDANALQLSGHEIVHRVKDADVTCITAMTPAVNAAITIAREIKGENSESTIIPGGPHATILPEDTLTRVREIDIIVIIVRGEEKKPLWNYLMRWKITGSCGISMELPIGITELKAFLHGLL